MRLLFVDSFFYIAVLLRRDRHHERAREIARSLRNCSYLTTDAVLLEVLAFVAEGGPQLREEAAGLVDDLRSDATVEIASINRELFDAGLKLYRERTDKGYSLADCIAMHLCAERGITEVLSHDVHFRQEGLVTLL